MNSSRIRKVQQETLSDHWYTLYKYTYDFQSTDGQWESQTREVYDRGNGAVILLYNPDAGTVVLTRQFRMPTYVNGNDDGMMIEACAGLLDGDAPEACIRKEMQEETGYTVGPVSKVFESYMSPGSVTEILHFFIAIYEPKMKTGAGGGIASETEHIEVLELGFEEALDMVKSGAIKDAKTTMLLQYAALNLKSELGLDQ